MAGILRMRRSRGVASGILLVLLGLWGGLIAFIGPYFHYAYTPDTAWTYNTGRLWLEILPGAATFLGGFLLIATNGRHVAGFGALLAAASGAWFTLGTVLSPLWNHNVPLGGSPASATVVMRIAEQLGFFTGLGVVIVCIASFAFGRVVSLSDEIEEIAPPLASPTTTETEPIEPLR
jgi:peptidoglycan/LPS O-acetylase OafA/YrhL